jgi:hypothetical protein
VDMSYRIQVTFQCEIYYLMVLFCLELQFLSAFKIQIADEMTEKLKKCVANCVTCNVTRTTVIVVVIICLYERCEVRINVWETVSTGDMSSSALISLR